MVSSDYPIERIREAFPALQRIEKDYFAGYFDGPGGTQVAKSVIDVMSNYMKNGVANLGGESPTSNETATLVAQARETVATLLGTNQENIVFGANMTTLAFRIARALRKTWGNDKGNIVVTEMDHHANIDPWITAVEDSQIDIHTIRVNEESKTLEMDALEAIITDETKLVAIGLASNAIGTINEVVPIIRRAKEVGALVALDGVHAVPHFTVNFNDLGADFLFCSAYKFFGPHVGIVAIKQTAFEQLTPFKLVPAPNEAPEILETGTINFEGLVGVTEAIQFIASIGDGNLLREKLNSAYKKITEYENHLANRLRNGLANIDHVTLYQANEQVFKTPTVAFKVTGMDAKVVCHYLTTHYSLHLEYGDFYAKILVERLEANTQGGLIRAGISPYNTEEEIDRLIEALQQLRQYIAIEQTEQK